MLTNEKELSIAVGVGPEPAFGAVVASAVLAASRQVPERDAHVLAREPFPIVTVLRVPHEAEPILATGVVAAVRSS